MSSMRDLKIENALYLVAAGLALGLRLAALGLIPLAEYEAGWALQAHHLALGDATGIGPQPLYLLVTGFLFRMFGSGDALARLLPVLAGGLLPLAVFPFRHWLGRWAALALTFGLALDPGLLAVSRLAGGPMPALALLLLGLAAWKQGWAAATGAFLGLALLSGPAIWAGLLGLILAALLDAVLRRAPLRLPGGEFRRAGMFLLGTLLLAGTFFLRLPGGLGAFGASLPAYVQAWGAPSGVSAGRLLLALVGYQPLAALFALVALVRLFIRPMNRDLALAAWLAAALALALLNPARQVTDLVWALVPLWALAAGALVELLALRPGEDRTVIWGEAALLLVFLGFIWLNIAPLGTSAFVDPDIVRIRLQLALIVLALALVSTALVAIGWSFGEALRGLLWCVALFLFFFTLNGATGAAYRRATAAAELWWNGPAPGLTDKLATTIGDISEYAIGERTGLDVAVQVDSAAVAWALRDMPNLVFSPTLPPALDHSAAVTDVSAIDRLTASGYRGQAFAISWQPPGQGDTPVNWLGWLFFRQAAVQPEIAIAWGRANLFPGGAPGVDLPPFVEPAPEEPAGEIEP